MAEPLATTDPPVPLLGSVIVKELVIAVVTSKVWSVKTVGAQIFVPPDWGDVTAVNVNKSPANIPWVAKLTVTVVVPLAVKVAPVWAADKGVMS